MALQPSVSNPKSALLRALRAIPLGRVATLDRLASHIGVAPRFVTLLLDGLSGDERELVPWHRVVAKGGAIGRGPHREAQFARLVREGVVVSPAGIVQDMERFAVAGFDDAGKGADEPGGAPPPPQTSRSRGMKDRPR